MDTDFLARCRSRVPQVGASFFPLFGSSGFLYVQWLECLPEQHNREGDQLAPNAQGWDGVHAEMRCDPGSIEGALRRRCTRTIERLVQGRKTQCLMTAATHHPLACAWMWRPVTCTGYRTKSIKCGTHVTLPMWNGLDHFSITRIVRRPAQ